MDRGNCDLVSGMYLTALSCLWLLFDYTYSHVIGVHIIAKLSLFASQDMLLSIATHL